MKRNSMLILLFMTIITTSCSDKTDEKIKSSNFSFNFRDTPCGPVPIDTYDSNTKTLVHTWLDGKEPITISLKLTEDELSQIFEKAVSIYFFELPQEIVPPENILTMTYAPASLYELSITNGKFSHSVSLDTEIITDPLYKNAEDFLDLFFFIRKIIREHPEYKKLPEDMAGCA